MDHPWRAMTRLATFVIVVIIIAWSLTACTGVPNTCAGMGTCPQVAATKPATPKPAGEPQPRPADPRPHEPTGNVKTPVTFMCIWERPRWIEFTPEIPIGNPRATKERQGLYTENQYDETIGVVPGTVVALVCNPMEDKDGLMICQISAWSLVLPGNAYRRVQKGKARCHGTVEG